MEFLMNPNKTKTEILWILPKLTIKKYWIRSLLQLCWEAFFDLHSPQKRKKEKDPTFK